jgi:hypothetical protein
MPGLHTTAKLVLLLVVWTLSTYGNNLRSPL